MMRILDPALVRGLPEQWRLFRRAADLVAGLVWLARDGEGWTVAFDLLETGARRDGVPLALAEETRELLRATFERWTGRKVGDFAMGPWSAPWAVGPYSGWVRVGPLEGIEAAWEVVAILRGGCDARSHQGHSTDGKRF